MELDVTKQSKKKIKKAKAKTKLHIKEIQQGFHIKLSREYNSFAFECGMTVAVADDQDPDDVCKELTKQLKAKINEQMQGLSIGLDNLL